MAVTLPLIVFALLFLIGARRSEGYRVAFVLAALWWGALLTGITEGLSALESFTPLAVGLAWMLIGMLLGGFLLLSPKGSRPFLLIGSPDIRSFIRSADGLLISTVVVMGCVIGLIAVIAPPNNDDSMSYHMARVRHWIQQQSVAHYPTHITRQLFSNPWAEFTIAHLFLLTGTDRLANSVQWFSMVGSLIAVSLIAARLGADKRGEVLAAVVAATIPMGILQASSTQNDYVTAFWLTCFCYVLLRIRDASEVTGPPWTWITCLGLSLGLAILTKGTAYVFAFPFLCWITWFLLCRRSWRALPMLAVVAGLVITLNIGHGLRNWTVFHSISGPEEMHQAFVNEVFTDPVLFVSNVVRNLSIELSTSDPDVNYYLRAVVRNVLRLIGADLNDPRVTYPGLSYYLSTQQTQEDWAGNPLHLLLIFSAGAVLIVARHRTNHETAGTYALALLAAFALFCICTKWQVWHNRLLLPLLLLGAPFVAAVFSRVIPGRSRLAVAVVLLVASLPALFANENRPLVGPRNILTMTREEQYYMVRNQWRPAYHQAVDLALRRNCTEIGVWMDWADYDYPLWVLLDQSERPYRISHVLVNNESGGLGFTRGSEPASVCAIVMTARREVPEPIRVIDVPLRPERPETIALHGRVFRPILQSDLMNIYGVEGAP
jgi:hypothetical protein